MVPLREVLAQVEPLEDANYTVLTKAMAMEDETILAWGMNGEPLPEMYGAPLRLRTESMHGYKMVKWVALGVVDRRLRRGRRRDGRHA